VDSTGLKLSGDGEWLVEKHGTSRRRSWRIPHIGVDAGTGRIAAAALTAIDVDDGSQVGPSLDQVAERYPNASVIVPPRSSAGTAETVPTPHDLHLQFITARGRMGWQKASGYNRRALVEANISRYKRVSGDALRSHTDGRQATEIAIAAGVLNQMLDLGRPESVRIV
jgi:hypothetical protein